MAEAATAARDRRAKSEDMCKSDERLRVMENSNSGEREYIYFSHAQMSSTGGGCSAFEDSAREDS